MSEELVCPFCGNLLPYTSFRTVGLCQNSTCRSHTYVSGNRVQHRFKQNLGVGTVKSFQELLKNTKKNLHHFLIKPEKPTNLDLFLTPQTPEKQESKKIFKKIIIEFESFTQQTAYPNELAHVLWKIGEKIRFQNYPDLDHEKPPILIGIVQNRNLHHKNGLIHYEVLQTDGKMVWIDERFILESVGDPMEEFYLGRTGSPYEFLLRIWSKQILDLYEGNNLKIITNSRLSLLPHQISVAHFLLHQPEARMILADEVGLGKTIEAGIYLKEMIARKLARRVLIIAPASLSSQWEFEMNNKFNLTFTRLNSKLLNQCEINFQSGNFINQNNGQEYTLCSTSLQYARLPQCSSKLLQIEWDIVIFDEAHHLRRYLTNAKSETYRTTLAYDLAEKLANKTRNILLLTATPIQLHAFDLYSLICLLNPYKFPNFDSFETERQQLVILNLIVRQLFNFTRISAFERRSLTYNILNFLPNYDVSELEANLSKVTFRKHLIAKLEQKHFLSDFVIRNRRKRVFPNHKIKRIANVIDVTLTPDELEVYNKIHLYLAKIYSQNFEGNNTGIGFVMVILQKLLTSSVPAILGSLKKRIKYLEENEDMLLKFQDEIILNQEFQDDELELEEDLGVEEFDLEDRFVYYKRKNKMKPKKENKLDIKQHIHILKEFVKDLTHLDYDSKAEKLREIITDIIQKDPNEKMIIFTQFKATLFYLAEIFEKLDIKVAYFHGDLNEQQKNSEVSKFKNSHSILLSTEIGGEGRNFQFCHIIINYDLPWNPMRLEQRIGRLDRIGQEHNIIIFNFYIADTVESSIINAIVDRIHLFEESIGSLEPILGGLEKQITKLVLKEDETPYKFRLEDVISKTSDKIEEVYNKLDDFILDKKSFQALNLSNQIQNPLLLTQEDLQRYLRVFSTYLQLFNTSQKNQIQNPSFDIILKKQVKDYNFWELNYSDFLKSKLALSKQHYTGVFDIDAARKFEEYDFFALGHETIMNPAEMCARDDFSPSASILSLDSKLLIHKILNSSTIKLSKQENRNLQEILKTNSNLHLFFIELQFTGIIIEKIVYPILINEFLNPFVGLTHIFYHPDSLFPLIKNLTFSSSKPSSNLRHSLEKLHELYDGALQALKDLATPRISTLTKLNREKYLKEKQKLYESAELKRKYIKNHLIKLDLSLRAKKIKLPTPRQLENVEKLTNPKRKQQRLDKFARIQEEVNYFENEIEYWEELEQELEFDIPAKLDKLEKHKKLQINANLLGYSRIDFN